MTHLTPVAFLGNISMQEILIVLVVVLLLFGAKRVPELARSLGKSLAEFRKGRAEEAEPDTAEDKDKEPAKKAGGPGKPA